ncbi:ABC transporter ATP-binding protein [Aquipseudomonas alcaligenes]|jgi:lipopolysaccharide transport system ATP-binding protein|uniref:ABC transporter ATP-binding protein n=1 Tax=Aquipseudomonas alcaligenes TaxID=43263 RepID=A0AB73HYD0_AQUAC|nr:ABC transporter ATP-binding protein [Pseudomonas alcaligenes]MDH0142979.1 ABC transporter ATP-binding protein [Pseudomonas alcaligenes]
MGHIRVSGLGKAYKQYPTRWSRLFEWLVPFAKPRHHLHWVLRGLDFEVQPGEALGLVGANGAGKSTLLKMITGTVLPTEGRVEIGGRVAALLELGMGFHPDFTGRQNVFMAGQLKGLSLEEITSLMPHIEAFAEIGDAIDQPVRTYSSGMQVRLAFSVATAHRPDVLIIDEALSVGDSYFQHKSFERIRQLRREGTTLLIVSHDRYAIQAICDRALLLQAGRLVSQGKPEEVLDYYNGLLAEREDATVRQELTADGVRRTISGSAEVRIGDVRLLDEQGQRLASVEVGSNVVLEVDAEVVKAVDRVVLGFMIKDRLGQSMYGVNTQRLGRVQENLQVGERLTFRFPFQMLLGAGTYSVALSLSEQDSHVAKNYEWRDYALMIKVTNRSREGFVGCVWLNAGIDVQRVASTSSVEML